MGIQNQIQLRRGTESEWISTNPVLASGEPGYETDTTRLKMGDGTTAWSGIPYSYIVPTGFLGGNNINISLGSNGSTATISVSGDVQSSQSLVTNVFNKTSNTIPKMTVVYIDGGQGDQPTIALALASGELRSSKTYGITAEAITSMNIGKVIVAGALSGLNTDQFNPTAPTGNVNGTTVWLSPTISGGITTSKPYAPYHMVSVGTIVRTHQNEGIIEVKIQNGFELEELHDVAITGATNGQFLQYNSNSGLWVPSSSGNFSSLTVNNVDIVLTSGNQSISGVKTFDNTLVLDSIGTSTFGSSQLYLDGSSMNRIDFNSNGVADPSLFTRSLGKKILLYPSLATATAEDFSLGIGGDGMGGGGSPTRFWQTINNASSRFQWYAGTTNIATLTGSGIFNTSKIGIGTSSPTGQFHVIGTGIISSRLGINTNSPTVALDVSGTIAANSGNFTDNLIVNNNIVWHSGNFNTTNIVRTTGTQIITGNKEFSIDTTTQFRDGSYLVYGDGTPNEYAVDILSDNISFPFRVRNTNGTEFSIGNYTNSDNDITITTIDDISLNYSTISFNGQSLYQTALGAGSNGQLLIGNGSSFAKSTLTATSGIGITNGSGSITIGVTGIPSSSITNFNSSVSGLLPTGTANYLSKFGTGGSGLSNSLVFDNGTNVGIGITDPAALLHVSGTVLANTFTTTSVNNINIGSGQIYLNGLTGNRIDFNGSGIGPPTFTNNRSSGTKIVLAPNTSSTQTEYALGIEAGAMWFSIPIATSRAFQWYAGTANIATLFGNGTLNIKGNTSQINVDGLRLDNNVLSITTTNDDLILKPNGSGALLADTSGNARGVYAVDLQRDRTSVSGVATGPYSVIAGGSDNRTSNSYSIVCGGQSNTASNAWALVCGGDLNIANGNRSVICGGGSNTSSAQSSTVGGGSSNQATGLYSIVPGGFRAKATRQGELSHAGGFFNAIGDAQHTILIARRLTTDATVDVVLTLNGNTPVSTNILNIPAQTSWAFSIKLSAYNNTNNEGAWWIFRGGVRRNNSNNTSLIGSLISENGADASLSSATASVVANDTDETLEIRVTGVAGKNIRWVAIVDISQVSFGAP